MALAAPGAVFLHCLPAHRGEEVAGEVIDGPASLVWPQAANRLRAMRGLLLWLFGGRRGVRRPRGHLDGLTKTQRQHRVSQILGKEEVTSQSELVRLLSEQGVEATQVTVSRDLEELGAVKVRRPGGSLVYALSEGPTSGLLLSCTSGGSWANGWQM